MAHFLGYVKGARGPATRLGHRTTGLTVKANGWNSGVTVTAEHRDGADVFTIAATHGSNGGGIARFVGTVLLDESGVPQFVGEKQ